MNRELLDRLPSPDEFRRRTQSMAALDAILCPDWEDRYYSFNATWSADTMMAAMNDGCGDLWYAIIQSAGIALHGLAHESETYHAERPEPWVFSELPAAFHESFLREPAFDTANSTYCIWLLTTDGKWRRGPAPRDVEDGFEEQMTILAEGADGYIEFAEDYYETELDRDAVQSVFAHAPVTDELAKRLNRDVDRAELARDLESIGFPSALT